MSIPLAQDGVSPTVEGREPSAMLAIGPEAKARVRILVIDDEHTLRESCAAVLRHEGYDVTVCSRGQEALDLLKRRAFDLVLVDLYMSQVDGLTLLRTALGTNHDTMVIVMTGNPSGWVFTEVGKSVGKALLICDNNPASVPPPPPIR